MPNFKPSELPVGTVIDDQEEGTFYKDAPGEWAELQYLDAGTQAIVWDEGPILQNVTNFRGNVVQTPADEYFKDFKILSMPMSVVESLIDDIEFEVEREWQGTVGFDREEVLRNAIEAVGKSNEES